MLLFFRRAQRGGAYLAVLRMGGAERRQTHQRIFEVAPSKLLACGQRSRAPQFADQQSNGKLKNLGEPVSGRRICRFHLTHHELLQPQELHTAALGPGHQGFAVGVEEDQAGQLGGEALLLVLQQGRRFLLPVADDQGDLSWVEGSETSARRSDLASIPTAGPTPRYIG